MRFVLALFLIIAMPIVGHAQDDDRGWLTGKLEGALSGAGRVVRIDGFAGALSSRATFDRLTIADDTGVWLTISGGAIKWNRAALLAGEVAISEMTAAAIDLPRLPASSRAGPGAEAGGFALPDLPVSVRIGSLAAQRVTLGAPVLGQPVTLSLDGAMELAGGSGAARLALTRTDAATGTLSLDAGFEAEPRRLRIDLLLDEAPGGIAAGLLGLPGTPAVRLAVAGVGPIDDIGTDIVLATDGAPRLSGRIQTRLADGARSFSARLSGDIRPLLTADVQPFFGPDVVLAAEGRRDALGRVDLTALRLAMAGLTAEGSLRLAPGGLPERFDFDLSAGAEDGPALRLPLPGGPVRLQQATARLAYDGATDDGWTLRADLSGLDQPGLDVAALHVEGSGRIRRGTMAAVGGRVLVQASGLAWADPARAAAFGAGLSARAGFHWQSGAPVALTGLALTAPGIAADAQASVSVGAEGPEVSGQGRLALSDMSRFAALAGHALSGRAEARLDGRFGLLSGLVDAEAQIDGTDLGIGQPQVDRALAGGTRLDLSLRRDVSGTTLRRFTVDAGPVQARAEGRIATGDGDLSGSVTVAALDRLDPRWRGALRADGHYRLTGDDAVIDLAGGADGLALGQAEIDRILAGQSRFSVRATGPATDPWVETARLTAPMLTLDLTGSGATGARQLSGSIRLDDLGVLVPDFPGPLTVTGRVTEAAAGVTLDLSGQGPGQTSARLTGQLSPDPDKTALRLAGSAQAALANPFLTPASVSGPLRFDLSLTGQPSVAALTGSVSLAAGRIALPSAGIGLAGVDARASLAAGRATLTAGAAVVGGGKVALTGAVGLLPGFPADLSVALTNASLTDPTLYRTRVSGRVDLTGPLTGGAIIGGALSLAETEVRVPESVPGGAGLLPGIEHRNLPDAARRTQARAGLLQAATGPAGPPFALDLSIDAPRQVFVRGRGIDAELGGALRLGGSTAAVAPVGRFDLIRGRVDILGKRFTLDEGQIGLEGALDPFLHFAARAVAGDITATIVIDGPASGPAVHFQSVPALPEEEIVARLLFGRGLGNLTPFQAAQLAAAVAVLAGQEGVDLVGRLRKGFGLDDLDVATSAAGATQVRLGKYLSENVYTDVTVGSDGKSEVSINLDIRPGVTAKGSVGSDGGTGVGLFFQRDY